LVVDGWPADSAETNLAPERPALNADSQRSSEQIKSLRSTAAIAGAGGAFNSTTNDIGGSCHDGKPMTGDLFRHPNKPR
jgi:hypothetical protein